jgi:hypothetical protein
VAHTLEPASDRLVSERLRSRHNPARQRPEMGSTKTGQQRESNVVVGLRALKHRERVVNNAHDNELTTIVSSSLQVRLRLLYLAFAAFF